MAHIPTLNTPTPIPTTCHHPTACLPTPIHPLLLLDLELDKTQTQLHPCPPPHLILIRTHTPNNPMGIHPLNLHLQATNLHHLRRPDTMFLTRLTRDRRLFRRRLDPMGSNRLMSCPHMVFPTINIRLHQPLLLLALFQLLLLLPLQLRRLPHLQSRVNYQRLRSPSLVITIMEWGIRIHQLL